MKYLKKLQKWQDSLLKKSERAKQAQADLDGVLATIPDKMQTIADQQERATTSTALMTKEYKILGGLVKTVLKKLLVLNELLMLQVMEWTM